MSGLEGAVVSACKLPEDYSLPQINSAPLMGLSGLCSRGKLILGIRYRRARTSSLSISLAATSNVLAAAD